MSRIHSHTNWLAIFKIQIIYCIQQSKIYITDKAML